MNIIQKSESLRFSKARIFLGAIALFIGGSTVLLLSGEYFYLQGIVKSSTFAASSQASVPESTATTTLVLPDWRMTTDCSAYSHDCVLRKLNQHSYAEYPFRFADEYNNWYEWQAALPEGWNQSLKEHIPTTSKHDAKPKDDPDCVDEALKKSVSDQIDHLLNILKRENSTNMISFAISDYKYARDMMEDVFEMAHNVVGFRDAFFVVAMDVPTMELACEFRYPFLAWPQPEPTKAGANKKSVSNTKFDISYELVKRGQSLFFFEMDVWFVTSPIPTLQEQTVDVMFSGHQNNPEAANSGVFSILANERSEEYLRICIELVEHSPENADQVVMQQVYYFLDRLKDGQPLEWSGHFKEPRPEIPTFEHPATHGRFLPFQIVADERPVASERTLAIHTLCGAPLRTPHGKKMIAKELGAWYGAGNYYRGKDNRYLWLDGHVWNGFSMAMSWPGFHPHYGYHSLDLLQWTIAATVALARRTGRIWVMPKLLNDAGVHFIWTILDMESVEALVDVRETNFPVNPKAWHSPAVPFESVARTAVGYHGKIFAQLSATDTSTSGDILAWNQSTYGDWRRPFDAWFAIHTAIPELVGAQVLLAGLPTISDQVKYLKDRVANKKNLTIVETEIVDVWKQLKWCDFRIGIDLEQIVGRTVAEWDCYSRGKHSA